MNLHQEHISLREGNKNWEKKNKEKEDKLEGQDRYHPQKKKTTRQNGCASQVP